MAGQIDISVILTTYNRQDYLRRALLSMTALDTHGLEWEIIVIDNASTDATASVIETFLDRLPLKTAHEQVRGASIAKNRALEMTCGRLIVFTDDDVLVDPQWLRELWRASRTWEGAGIFGGRIQPVLPDRLPSWLRSDDMRAAMTRRFGYHYPRVDEGYSSKSPLGGNNAIRAALLGQLRFDEKRGPDGTENYVQSAETDLIGKLIDVGHRIVFVPTARVEHLVRPEQLTICGLNQRAFRRGRKNAAVDPSRYSGTVLFGAPLKLWFDIARLSIRALVMRPFGKRIRYPVENKLAFRRGFLYQHRLDHRGSQRAMRSSDAA